jgi:hypothetical protein
MDASNQIDINRKIRLSGVATDLRRSSTSRHGNIEGWKYLICFETPRRQLKPMKLSGGSLFGGLSWSRIKTGSGPRKIEPDPDTVKRSCGTGDHHLFVLNSR